MQPMNYTIQTEGPANAFQSGFQNTAGMMATVAEFQKAQAMAQAQQMKNEQDAYKRQRLQQVAQNPTIQDVQKLMIEIPELHEALGKTLNSMSETDKQSTVSSAFSVLSALKNGNQDAALSVIDQHIKAAKNSNRPDLLQMYETNRDLVLADPKAAQLVLTGNMYAAMGGKEFAEATKTLAEAELKQATKDSDIRKAGAEATKAEADAVTAQSKAKFADSDAAMELQKKGWDIKKIQADIDINKQNSRIAAMNAQTARMNSGIQSQELQLKLGEAIRKRDETVRTKVAEAENARAGIDNFLNTADRLLSNPMLDRVLGAVEGRFTSAPLSDEAADAISLIETLKSQAFLSQIPAMKGTGNLSEKEGDKLEAALTNLSRVQSEKQFRANLNDAARILIKSRKGLSEKYGIPDTIPDTPAANAKNSGKSTDQILKELGVMK